MRRSDIARGDWLPPGAARVRRLSFGEYATSWLEHRDPKPRTRELYRSLLDRILPNFADAPLSTITPTLVRSWYSEQGTATPTARAHAYGLLKAIWRPL
jgi:hypothetical protein